MSSNGIVPGSEHNEVLEHLRGRRKFHMVGSPMRVIMDRAIASIDSLLSERCFCEDTEVIFDTELGLSSFDAVGVQAWLSDQGVKLTPKQKRTLNLEE